MRIVSSFKRDVPHSSWNVRSSSVVQQPVPDCEEARYILEKTLFLSTCFPIAIDYMLDKSLRGFIAFLFTPQFFEWNEFISGTVNTEIIKRGLKSLT